MRAIDGWMDVMRWMDGCHEMDGWMPSSILLCVYEDESGMITLVVSKGIRLQRQPHGLAVDHGDSRDAHIGNALVMTIRLWKHTKHTNHHQQQPPIKIH